MTKYRNRLPQLNGGLFLSDAGIETTLIFEDGFELPYFAAFHLLQDQAGTEGLRTYFRRHAKIARDARTGFILESPTWRASPDWGQKLGYTPEALDAANRVALRLMHELREEFETPSSPMVISGCVGPRGDGYEAGRIMSPEEAEAYHARQIRLYAEEGADMATAITMTNVNEAIGVARAAKAAGLPVAISFTVETDGTLPAGDRLGDAIAAVDAATGRYPAYYMINCAHPDHFNAVLKGEWVKRIGGIRANASRCSHAELDEAEVLDSGNPQELGQQYRDLRARFPQINVLGGCCGTDHRHIEAISSACLEAA
ncbi:homocysteine S-methyltransferase family protein [Parvibaculum sp.]|uniref:homocysteine S-methyltransferase family protein n=1 Tax=Parvibaculum sp. TaxID=2024848 RepID=UPI00272F92C0|nr:homocysteine S-methyltransferase family protein [Parvibaculum sp.]MDP1627677.1 homocysteine S-methyltransferase family protein [Parvibaculum sp.]MDP2150675.1 homocysteine S-methyltransferase family protein [Parvibaculum sp.]MDP3329693.1 homocysteine S-methyltransferase family protein [Parvibaculum sp.]